MNFEFATATRIIFGAGKMREVGGLAAEMGSRALVVTGSAAERAAALLDTLRLPYTLFQVTGEPSIEVAQAGVDLARVEGCDLVIAFGGGSVIDTAKAVAALATNPGDPLDYLEVIGKGQPLTVAPLPVIAIPTTAGTGAEVTRNAVLASQEQQVKVSLRSPLMLPRLAVIDPELTYSMPPSVTAYTGMDALTQVLEPYVSNAANPLTDGLCREGLMRAGRSLQRAYENDRDPAAREDMALASLFGGLALANAKLGAVHGFAGVIGGMFDAPHGAVCARLLPFVAEANIKALESREPGHPALQRYAEIMLLLTNHAVTNPIPDGLNWLYRLGARLGIPRLSHYGIRATHIPALVEKSARASSMKGNPIVLTDAELSAILEQAL